ncbi:MAG: hypothetical protein JKY81_04240 [Colwellia sp.]|nr:hypothetical protein [Colwellia sp.]
MNNEKWEKTRKIGKLKFVIIYGLYFFLISSSLYLLYVKFGQSEGSFIDHLIILCILLISGVSWSFGYWKQMQKNNR